ncbi:hypothetical protein DH26_gp015 [Chloriridovirus anopheles1]|uniref:DUF1868 domain-containing protein n=1 Tax=Chloriridovirus anopheles1 TaxID=1465751 RepID=W8R9J4_9VIRU|nr:hypothetical protein DH26_gp015 [Anopheles minimus iridovirus]AHL67516.1 hypothetical protein AMIV_015 [Anopheles minimus iridovirus]
MSLTKIDSKGVYQPFFGYTVIGMLEDECLASASNIENFIRTSSLNEFFAPLPANTYHMTLFNIYVVGGPEIPSVSKWLQNGNKIYSAHSWLPDEVLCNANMAAFNYLKNKTSLKLTRSKFKFSKKSLGVLVELEDCEYKKVFDARVALSKIYEHQDSSLANRNSLHITFAYGYKRQDNFSKQNMADLKILEQMVNSAFQSVKLKIPELYLFNSMDNYVAFGDFCTSVY